MVVKIYIYMVVYGVNSRDTFEHLLNIYCFLADIGRKNKHKISQKKAICKFVSYRRLEKNLVFYNETLIIKVLSYHSFCPPECHSMSRHECVLPFDLLSTWLSHKRLI